MNQKSPNSQKLILYGVHAVNAALKNPKRNIKKLYVTEDQSSQYKHLGDKVIVVHKSDFKKIVPMDAVHQGIALETAPLTTLHLEELPIEKTPCVLLAFDQVTDPHNVGAILRSAACFNVDGIIHTERNSPAESGVLAKSASGALEQIPFCRVVNLVRALEELKEKGFWTIGLAETGSDYLHQIDLPSKVVLVVGAEGDGLRRLTLSKCDYVAKLPTNPDFPTLNASNAAAVALYSIQQKLRIS